MTESIGKALAHAMKEPAAPGPERPGRHIFRNQHRRDIFSMLTTRPFLSCSAVASALGLSPNTVNWHVGRLMDAGYVAKHSAGKHTLFFPEGLVDRRDAELLRWVNHPGRGAIYGKVLSSPGMAQSDIATATGESRQAVARALNGLVIIGLVTAVTDGTRQRYYPTRLLPEKGEAFFKRSRDFSEYILRRLEQEGGKPPSVVKHGLDTILVEMGYAPDRFTMEIGINPFMTCGVC